ncbi:MAG: sulfurtransferase [Actinomycetota bacterium]
MSTAQEVVPPGHVVDGAWLEARLGHPRLRVIDATVVLDPETWGASSGRQRYEAGHVPGSTFADLVGELSDPEGDAGLPDGVHAYRLPPTTQFEEAIARHGVGNDSVVVAYDTSAGMWAARLWWMLRVFGHDHVAVLDGGWQRWVAERRPVSTETVAPEPGSFTAGWRPELLAGKDEVAARIGDPDAVLVNALWPAQFRGEQPLPIGRSGRIPGSVNVPLTDTLDEHGCLRDRQALSQRFADEGVTDGQRVITYCGGGIAASLDALALAEVGIDAAVYDGSLVEWGSDPDAPLETG